MIKNQPNPVWVVIPAAGTGQRMQLELPKQYLKILDKTIIEHTLACFLSHSHIAGVLVVISEDDRYWDTLDIKLEQTSNLLFASRITVEEGSTRSDSVMHGLEYLKQELNVAEDTWVMVHDAARPCVSDTDLDSLLEVCASKSCGALLASPVRDTMKRSFDTSKNSTKDTSLRVSHTESRSNLWHALTPQMFRLAELQEAIEYCREQGLEMTDESSAMENKGAEPVLVEGSHNNIKVTYPSDIELATFFLNKKDKGL